MGVLDDYYKQSQYWSGKKTEYERKENRLKKAKSSYHSCLRNDLSDHIKEYKKVYKKLDDDSSNEGDWEGNQIKKVQNKMKESITNQYSDLKERHGSVIDEMATQESKFAKLKEEAQGKVDYYNNLIANYDEDED